MTKTFCDRCGKEIINPKVKIYRWTQYKRKLSWTGDMIGESEIQICADCEQDFRNWLIEKGHVIIGWREKGPIIIGRK